jgi:starch synthase
VSQSYLKELSLYSNGLEYLFAAERDKGVGIINGIDTDVWNPQTDTMIVKQYAARTVGKGKETNKAALCAEFGLNADKPLVSFIGRLVGEKGADLLYDIIVRSLDKHKGELNFMVLGSGEPEIERALASIRDNYSGSYNVMIGYNEALSHRIYAASDFLIMPSRVEPCGLNQLYSMRYGTLPVVRSTGGLKDTVIDFESEGGYGVSFDDAGVESACTAVDRSVALFANTAKINTLRKKIMALDFSWGQSANQYIDLYTSLIS